MLFFDRELVAVTGIKNRRQGTRSCAMNRKADPNDDLVGTNEDRPRQSVCFGRFFIEGTAVQNEAHGASVSSTSSTSKTKGRSPRRLPESAGPCGTDPPKSRRRPGWSAGRQSPAAARLLCWIACRCSSLSDAFIAIPPFLIVTRSNRATQVRPGACRPARRARFVPACPFEN